MRLPSIPLPTARTACSLLLVAALLAPTAATAEDPPKIHIAFLWHMHQPIYQPGETVVETDANARYPFSVIDVHLTRTGPYTTWPGDAVASGVAAGLPHLGAQVSFSGSLVRNLDALAAAGYGQFATWTSSWTQWSTANTALGNPRIDMVAFGEHHPLMPLIAPEDVGAQIARHRQILADRIGAPASRGIFPPENAVHPRMIGALVDAGLEWVLVDNVHFDRAAEGYPWNSGGNLVEPNAAEVRNPDPGDWVSLSGLWAPTPVSARWGHQPHWMQTIDPVTGDVKRIVAVPTSRYLGNEDGRGGFGALDYEAVMSQLEPFNTDSAHPILVVLHHDGDNHGGGSDSYYHANFDAFVQWLLANPDRFEATTIQDYLDRFPPAADDLIHVEPGSWSGADNGDPEFAKWLGDPNADGESPDRNSWAVLTAATNRVRQALDVAPTDPRSLAAQDFLLNGQASDYWYWDFSLDGVWDSQPTRAANLALQELGALLDGTDDSVGPTVFAPQREPYNPGATEWGVVQPTDFEVWTLVDDHADVQSVILRVREDLDGTLPIDAPDNATYAGGPDVGAWQEIPMSVDPMPTATTDPLPTVRATRYRATVEASPNTLYDLTVRAVDTHGNVTDSPIDHVAVGGGGSGDTDPGAPFTMDGTLDARTTPVDGTETLYLRVEGDWLYLATTPAAGSGDDVFLMVSADAAPSIAAPWAKSGTVPRWSAFAGAEASNGWCGWFDAEGDADVTSGSVLEARIDLAAEFGGTVPTAFHVAALRYGSDDGASLVGQAPAGDGDDTVTLEEFHEVRRTTVDAPAAPRGPVTLHTARPNPFNPRTEVRFDLARAAHVDLAVFDLRGRHVVTLRAGRFAEGSHRAVFDGGALASGVYLVRLAALGSIEVQRVILAK
ncbi:MAG TPA: T9SS type A sorting domain-containing protein [Candidatus Krumholzibacteria bacterium]|nr:T9SS type A sorting domain-containing protein [Candidatus Krumholzibacteria bacterium]